MRKHTNQLRHLFGGSRVNRDKRTLIVHGQTCEKAPHLTAGYSHPEEDDSPYWVDNVCYCGRCHTYLPDHPVDVDAEVGFGFGSGDYMPPKV